MKKLILDPTLPARPLTDLKKPWGIIRFKSGVDVHTFYSCVNEMTGHRLSAFDNDPPSVCRYEGSYRDDAKVFDNIRNKSTEVLAFSGTVHFQ